MNTILTVERAIIQLGDIDLDVFRLPDASYCLSESGTENAIKRPRNSFRNFKNSNAPEAIAFATFERTSFKVEGERARCIGIPINFAVAYWVHHARKGNRMAIELLRAISESNHKAFHDLRPEAFTLLVRAEPPQKYRSKVKTHTEAWYVKKMQEAIGGRREVATESGNIDLLTVDQIIEFKEAKSWKCAIGQILVYGSYYPSHLKRIHLFGTCHSSFLSIVKKHCDPLNIVLTWEP